MKRHIKNHVTTTTDNLNPMKKFFPALILLFLWIIPSYGQVTSGNIEMSALNVLVLDAGNKEPLQMATVYIMPAGDTTVTSFSFTDKHGRAILKDFAAGNYVVNVQMLGFKPYAEEMTLKPRIVGSVTVRLEEDLEELEGATITEMGDMVTMKGDTLIYNATSFQVGSNANLGDLLKKMPGIEVNNGRVTVNGEPVRRITVEGKTFFFDDQSKALENLPAFIVNKIKVIDKESQGRFGLSGKEKEMDVGLKEEYRESWFGRISAEGGASVRDKSSDMFGEGIDGLYNGKVYAQFYSEDDNVTVLGGGNNVNVNQMSQTSSGLSDIASGGVNYNTSRIPGYNTTASASYDFRSTDDRSESRRTSFLSSGEQLETSSSRTGTDISHSTKAGFGIKPSMFELPTAEGVSVRGSFLYNRKKSADESKSSTTDSSGGELNGSESLTDGTSNDFNAKVNVRGRYFLDNEYRNSISFEGNVGYDGSRGNSRESSVTRLGTSSDERSLLYTDKSDAMRLNAYVYYSGKLSSNWRMSASLSADLNSSKDNRDAENASDNSRNEYYSKYSTDRGINLSQAVSATYDVKYGDQKSFRTSLGVSVYEDNISRFSRAFGAVEDSNDSWQVNAGPDIFLNLWNGPWRYSLYTRGKSMASPQGAANSTMLDVSNPVDISTGNIYLKTGYHQDVNFVLTYGSRRPGSSYVDMRLSGSVDLNELTRASWYDASAVRYSIPVNAERPRYNSGLNVTYIQPLNKKRNLTLTMTPKVLYSTRTIYVSDGVLPGIDKDKFDYAEMMEWFYGDSEGSEFYSGRSGFIENRTQNLNWSVNADLKYELQSWSLTGGLSAANSRTAYSASPSAKVNNWRYNAYVNALWWNKSGWKAEGRFDYSGYSGFRYFRKFEVLHPQCFRRICRGYVPQQSWPLHPHRSVIRFRQMEFPETDEDGLYGKAKQSLIAGSSIVRYRVP